MPKVTAEHVEARKSQILDAALACFGRKGFHQTTMQDICHQCGLSPGAIYRYFRSKEDIVESASERDRVKEIVLIRQLRRRLSTPEVLDALVQHFFGMLASLGDGSPGHLEHWSESQRNSRLHENLWRNYQEYVNAIASIVRQGITEGKFNANLDPKTMITDGLSAPLHQGAVRYYREKGWL